ncbi:hypothetical protein, partial [Fibrobacter sp. UWT2]|uniref:hypothetical protein n=1 Tax=Fibrobacter sp. UWT2 TaxID=1896224 RepID=UPI001C4A2E59
HILENLAIFSQGRNQFFPIVMRAGRDFKGRLSKCSYGEFSRSIHSLILIPFLIENSDAGAEATFDEFANVVAINNIRTNGNTSIHVDVFLIIFFI